MYNWAKVVGLVFAMFAVVLSSLAPTAIAASDDYRWFEIEVLFFRHLSAPDSDAEVFPTAITPIPTLGARDLITPLLNPHKLRGLIAALPVCTWVRDLPHGVGEFELNKYNQHQRLFKPLPGLTGARLTNDDIFCRYHQHAIITDRLYATTPPDPGMEVWDKTPAVIAGVGGDMTELAGPFLLDKNALTFNELKSQLERRGLARTLLHTSWRQPVFNRNATQYLRLFGGHNFTSDFDYFGFSKQHDSELSSFEGTSPLLFEEKNPSQQQLNRLEELLSAINDEKFHFVRPAQSEDLLPIAPDQPPRGLPNDVWELDGLFRVYLVGNYLHIDTNFNLREPENFSQQLSSVEEQANAWLQGEVEEVPFLRAYHLNQLRRVISHEMHYFDHPKFGILVEIRRTDRSQR